MAECANGLDATDIPAYAQTAAAMSTAMNLLPARILSDSRS
jgi:hypothetical protein